MKKVFNYICLGLLGVYAALPFIPVFYYHVDDMRYDASLDKYVPYKADEFFSALDNFPGGHGNLFLGIITWVVLYLLIATTVFFFIKDFKNNKKRKWISFIATSVAMFAFICLSFAPRGF